MHVEVRAEPLSDAGSIPAASTTDIIMKEGPDHCDRGLLNVYSASRASFYLYIALMLAQEDSSSGVT